MFKKTLVFLTILAVIGLGAFAGQVEITFWHAMSGEHGKVLQKLADKFMADNPNIKVKLMFQGNFWQLPAKVLTAVTAGNPPVISQIYGNETLQYINAGALLPLGEVLPDSILNDIPEPLIKINSYEVNGKSELVTVPFNRSAMVLYYNTDLVKSPPKTWDELLAMAKALTKDGIYGFGLHPSHGEPPFTVFLHQAGGQVLSDDITTCTLNSEAGVNAMQFLLKLKQYSYYSTQYLSGPFGAGKVAMYIGSSAGIPFVAKASKGHHGWSTAVLPQGPVSNETLIGGSDIGIFILGTTKAQQEAAVKFVEFLLSKKATLEWAENTGYLPVLKSAINSDEWKAFVKEHPEANAGAQMVFHGFGFPHQRNWYDIDLIVTEAYEQAMLGKLTPKEALDQAADKIQDKYLK